MSALSKELKRRYRPKPRSHYNNEGKGGRNRTLAIRNKALMSEKFTTSRREASWSQSNRHRNQ